MNDPMSPEKKWKLYHGTREAGDALSRLPDPPRWRPRRAPPVAPGQDRWWPRTEADDALLPPATLQRGRNFHATEHIIEMVNAALYLRRPLLVTGQPGSGKSSLVDAVAYELRMGAPLRWNVTSRSSLREAQYQYDAIGRLQQKEELPIGEYVPSAVVCTPMSQSSTRSPVRRNS